MKQKKLTRFLWAIIKPYKWHYLFMLQAPLIYAFYFPMSHYAVKLIIDTLSSQESFTLTDLKIPIIIYITTQILLDVSWRISNIADVYATPYIKAAMTQKAYEYVSRHSFQFFQDHLSGTVANKINALQQYYTEIFEIIHFRLIHRSVNLLVVIIFLSIICYPLALFISVWLIIFSLIMSVLARRLTDLSIKVSRSKHRAFGFITDNISNIINILFFAAHNQEAENVRKKLDSVVKNDRNRIIYDCIINTVGGVLYWIMLIGFLFLMIYYRKQGMVTIGDFALVFGMVFQAAENTWKMIYEVQRIFKNWGELKQSFDIQTIPHEIIDDKDAKDLVVTAGDIHFNNVSFAYDNNKPIFEGLNLTIKSGEKVGVVGYSGSGKTTLVKLLLRLFDIQNGTITIDTQDIKNVTQESLRKNISMIPQDTSLFHRTLIENIHYGNPDATDDEIIKAAQEAHTHEFISELKDGYKTLVGERGIKLSGGQRQRIAIARAFLKRSPITILDEATSSLDSQTEQYIQESLNTLIADKTTTVIAIAHRLSTLKHMDRIIVFDGGTIAEEGTHDQLLKIGKLYKKLWDMQKI